MLTYISVCVNFDLSKEFTIFGFISKNDYTSEEKWDHKFLRGKTNQNVLTNIYKNTAFKYMYIGLVDTNLKAYSRFLF